MSRDRLLKKNGKESLREDRPTMFFEITAPEGTKILPIHDDGREARWTLSPRGVRKAADEQRLIWKQRERDGHPVWVPYIREFAPASPDRPHETILLDVKTSRQAKAHQRELLPDTPVFETVKPEQLIQRILEISTRPGDLVLDSFLGSGTTAAAAHKLNRRWIGVEDGEHALTYCLPRLTKVVQGEPGGISEELDWQGGGGFRFMKLGVNAFRADGRVNPEIRFAALASFIWFSETRHPTERKRFTRPVLGVHAGVAYVLLYNGILGDKSPNGGNVLTASVWNDLRQCLPVDVRQTTVYGEACHLSRARLKQLRATFKQIPYDVGIR
jgi:adenine-specific DNA-methyltransferase